MGYVYVLLLSNGAYYVGSSDDVERRYMEHKQGKVVSTKNHLPVKLLYTRQFETLSIARKIEYRIKSTKKRVYVEKFISGEYTPMID